jgi:ribosomal protein S18 acetylase RimI-like enzyme
MPHVTEPLDLAEATPDLREAVVALTLRSYEEYRPAMSGWAAFAQLLAEASGRTGTLVARVRGELVGAVTYVSPGAPRPAFYDPDWALVRLLAVDPRARGLGVGRVLLEECVRRAVADRAAVLGLHTTPVMATALAMYLRRGFVKVREIPHDSGLPYAVYAMRLAEDHA